MMPAHVSQTCALWDVSTFISSSGTTTTIPGGECAPDFTPWVQVRHVGMPVLVGHPREGYEGKVSISTLSDMNTSSNYHKIVANKVRIGKGSRSGT